MIEWITNTGLLIQLFLNIVLVLVLAIIAVLLVIVFALTLKHAIMATFLARKSDKESIHE